MFCVVLLGFHCRKNSIIIYGPSQLECFRIYFNREIKAWHLHNAEEFIKTHIHCRSSALCNVQRFRLHEKSFKKTMRMGKCRTRSCSTVNDTHFKLTPEEKAKKNLVRRWTKLHMCTAACRFKFFICLLPVKPLGEHDLSKSTLKRHQIMKLNVKMSFVSALIISQWYRVLNIVKSFDRNLMD